MKRRAALSLPLRAAALALGLALALPCALATPARADEGGGATYSASEEPSLASPSAFLMDLDTGTVLLAKDADSRRYPASTTKVMTALLVLERASLDDVVTMDQADFDELTSDSSTAGLQVGETLTVRDLLACLLLPSGNEAAYALARHVSGDWQSFVELMNARAAELGCSGTHFANPCGLHADDHYTTAHDLALIFSAAMAHAEFAEIAGASSWELPATNLSAARTIETTNLLSDPDSAVYMGDTIVAAKTGYTGDAGKCLAVGAQRDGMRLVGVVLGASSVADASGVTENFYDMRTMLEWGFGAWTTCDVVSAGDVLATAPVELSTDGDEVDVAATGDVLATVPRGTTVADLTVEVPWTEPLRAPLDQGKGLGVATVSLDGRVLGTVGVATAHAMGLSLVAFAFDWLSDPLNTVVAVVVFVAVAVLVWLVATSGSRRRARNRSRYRISVGERPRVSPGAGGRRLEVPSQHGRGPRHGAHHRR